VVSAILVAAALLAEVVTAGGARAQRRLESSAPLPPLRIAVGVAVEGREAVVDDQFVQAQIATANRVFSPHGVSFVLAERRAIGESFAHLHSRADRDSLGSILRPEVINAFFVATLRDVGDHSLFRMGVHWRPRRGRPVFGHLAHCVIVTRSARPTSLAHELGHFFGNGHTTDPINVMSYSMQPGERELDPAQAVRARSFARRFLRTGELVP